MLVDEVTLGSLLKCAVHWPGVPEPSQTAAHITGVTPSSLVCDGVGISPSMMEFRSGPLGRTPEEMYQLVERLGPESSPRRPEEMALETLWEDSGCGCPRGVGALWQDHYHKLEAPRLGPLRLRTATLTQLGKLHRRDTHGQRKGLNDEHRPDFLCAL